MTAARRLPDLWRIDRAALIGHARMFAHPAYARIVTTEPLVRRLIPLLIVLFVLALAFTRTVALLEQRSGAETDARKDIALIAKSVLVDLTEMESLIPTSGATQAMHGILANALPAGALARGRSVLSVNPDNQVTAVLPESPDMLGKYLDELFGPGQPLTTLGARAGVLRISMPAGSDSFATVHHGFGKVGAVAVLQPVSAVYAPWRATIAREATVFVATSVVLVILGFAYHAQVARAAEADFIYSRTQERFHMALGRGRSGLWDWDLSRGAVFWSPSMFRILGLEPREELIAIGELTELIHPEDTDLVELAEGLLRSPNAEVDREFRMRHADGHWVWVRARGEVVENPDERPHMIGIAVDVTERRKLAEASRTADLRLRDAVEAISEAFVLWDSTDRLVLCNSSTKRSTGCPTILCGPEPAMTTSPMPGARRSWSTACPMTSKWPDRSRSRRASRTGAGCRSASGAPRMAVSSPSAPTSRR